MNLLLDTHVVLWWLSGDRQLRAGARRAIAGAGEVWVSAASAWEVAIKMALGRLRLPGAFEDAVQSSGFRELAVTFRHSALAGALPDHHRDPVGRMRIAQALAEGLTMVTHDETLQRYGISLLAV